MVAMIGVVFWAIEMNSQEMATNRKEGMQSLFNCHIKDHLCSRFAEATGNSNTEIKI